VNGYSALALLGAILAVTIYNANALTRAVTLLEIIGMK